MESRNLIQMIISVFIIIIGLVIIIRFRHLQPGLIEIIGIAFILTGIGQLINSTKK